MGTGTYFCAGDICPEEKGSGEGRGGTGSVKRTTGGHSKRRGRPYATRDTGYGLNKTTSVEIGMLLVWR